MAQFRDTLLFDIAEETLLPGEVFDNANVGEDLVGRVNPSVGSSQNLLLGRGELLCDPHVDRKQQGHHTDSDNTTVAENLVEQDDGEYKLNGRFSPEEVQVSTDFGNLERIHSHEVDDGTRRNLGIVLGLLASVSLGVVRFSLAPESRDLLHPALFWLVIRCLLLLLSENLVRACSSPPAKSFAIDLTNDDSPQPDADFAALPESLATGESVDDA